MKRTTIFLPEAIHEELRQEAFRSRVTMAELIRSRLQVKPARNSKRAQTVNPLLKVAGICRGKLLSEDIDEHLYG